MPGVSVIIPTLNEEANIGKCLSYLKNQDYKDFETIIADGMSTDRTRYIARMSGAKIVDVPERGFGVAKNLGTNASNGDMCFYLDADTKPPNDWISRFLNEYDKDKGTVMVGPLYRFDEARYYSLYRPLNFGRKMLAKLSIPLICASGMSIRRDAFYKVGGFTNDPCEDADICLKARKVGKVKLMTDVYMQTSSRDWHREHSIPKHFLFDTVYALTQGKVRLREATGITR
jgi:glycosyltransferase involved in cell wall biosynthesis